MELTATPQAHVLRTRNVGAQWPCLYPDHRRAQTWRRPQGTWGELHGFRGKQFTEHMPPSQALSTAPSPMGNGRASCAHLLPPRNLPPMPHPLHIPPSPLPVPFPPSRYPEPFCGAQARPTNASAPFCEMDVHGISGSRTTPDILKPPNASKFTRFLIQA